MTDLSMKVADYCGFSAIILDGGLVHGALLVCARESGRPQVPGNGHAASARVI